ncbi:adenylate/guanylate cyclase domain-containing protein [Terasakiella pusilla]|uniref:adenylate/guanylate cyclase domain-containing protein n=1 Tax=Terasakiella pusilla TaxID=64973 RepID=UPI003AA99B1F
MGTHENQTYEVHVHTNGRWHVHARFPFHQRSLAIREAQQLDKEQAGQPVRIVLEEYNPETGRHNEIVIYRNRVEPAVKPKVRARRGNSWADIAVSADGRVGYVNDKAQDTFEDPFSEYERPKAHVGVGMFLAIISTIIVIGLGAGGAAAAMLALLMEGFDVTMADKLRKAMLVGMFIVVFLIACLSSISYYTQRFDLNPFKKKHKTPAPQPVTKISQEMQKAAAEIDKMPVLVVEKTNPEEKEKEETFSIFDNIGNLEITQPDDTIAFSEKAEEQKMLMVNFLGTCLGALKGPNAKAENLNRFGLNLFMTGAVSRLARDNKLTDDEFDVILRRILEMLGAKPDQAERFALEFEKHLDDPRHQALFDRSGDIVQRFKNGDRSAPLQIRETIESWVNWKNEAELAINPNLLIIMFTDMVGSTDLASKHGDYAAQEVLKAHDLIVRTALTNFDGREIKHLGDGIMASFKDHDKAIQAAIEIQKRVDGNNSSAPEFPLHVRIGLNAGEPIKKDNDLFGNAVQLAARICDNAASDCINLSQDLKNLFGEKPAYTFAPLGAQMLKGFEEAQNLYILDWKAPLITYPAETPVPAPIPVEGTPENNKVELVATEGIAPDMAAQKPVKQIREDPNFARGMVLTPKKTPSAQPDPDKKTT